MNEEEQRIAIAEACGFNITRVEKELRTGEIIRVWAETPDSWGGMDVRPWVPDFVNDLNAMHEAEKVLPADRLEIYASWLRDGNSSGGTPAELYHWHASATKRAEAFLRTLGLWVDHTR